MACQRVTTPVTKRATRVERATFSLEGRGPAVLTQETASTYETQPERLSFSLSNRLREDAQLHAIVAAWSNLPDTVKASIVAIVNAMKGGRAGTGDTGDSD